MHLNNWKIDFEKILKEKVPLKRFWFHLENENLFFISITFLKGNRKNIESCAILFLENEIKFFWQAWPIGIRILVSEGSEWQWVFYRETCVSYAAKVQDGKFLRSDWWWHPFQPADPHYFAKHLFSIKIFSF